VKNQWERKIRGKKFEFLRLTHVYVLLGQWFYDNDSREEEETEDAWELGKLGCSAF
jgi:hypothetical protein